MRFWSLKTFRWIFVHGMSCHLYIGGFTAVFIACVLLLVPLPLNHRACVSVSSGFPGGLCFSSNLTLLPHTVDTYSGLCFDLCRRAKEGLTRSEYSFCVAVGLCFTPGLFME